MKHNWNQKATTGPVAAVAGVAAANKQTKYRGQTAVSPTKQITSESSAPVKLDCRACRLPIVGCLCPLVRWMQHRVCTFSHRPHLHPCEAYQVGRQRCCIGIVGKQCRSSCQAARKEVHSASKEIIEGPHAACLTRREKL